MKALFSIVLALSLLCPSAAYAMEVPVLKDDSASAAQVYNEQVDEYNTWAKQENIERALDYEAEASEIARYNQEQKKLYEENQAAIQEQEERLERIAADANLGFKYQTDGFPSIDLYNEYITNEPLTITPSVRGLPGDAFAVALHIYLKEDAHFPMIDMAYDHLIFDSYNSDKVLSYEGEAIWVDTKQKINFTNQLDLLDCPGGRVERYFEGYTNGYWKVSPLVIGQNVDFQVQQNIYNTVEAWTEQDYQSFGVVYYYEFVRTGPEPETVEPFTPVYKELPQEPTYITLLDKVKVPEEPEQSTDTPQVSAGDTLPQTGDNTLTLLIILAIIDLIVLSGIAFYMYKTS